MTTAMTIRVLGVAFHLLLDPYLLLIPLAISFTLQRSSKVWAHGYQSAHAHYPVLARNSVVAQWIYLAEFTKGNLIMLLLLKVRKTWGTIRCKMLIIFLFSSVLSTILIAILSIAVLNIVIRRENAYLVEERLAAMTDNQQLIARIAGRESTCSDLAHGHSFVQRFSDLAWAGTRTTVMTHDRVRTMDPQPTWLADSFSSIVRDHERFAIRSYREIGRGACVFAVLADTPLDPAAISQISHAAGLQITNNRPIRLLRYRALQSIREQFASNFIPLHNRDVPVVITATNWQTGKVEDWVICRVRPSYKRTVADISHMGLQPAAWLGPLAGLFFALVCVYAGGFIFSVHLSQSVVASIDGLSHAAQRVGKGDFSTRLPTARQDQLGELASSFNAMTRDLEDLRNQEKEAALLDWDMVLAREIQQHLHPRSDSVIAGVTICGKNIPARRVSGDLYQFFPLDKDKVALLCADVSGKGAPAALMMTHLQALIFGQLLSPEECRARRSPELLMAALNRDLYARFGPSRYATVFYGEYEPASCLLHFVNAGHCPPMLISDKGHVTTVRHGNLPIGLFPEASYEEFSVTLSPGSFLVVYTDGVTEAANEQEEEFGEERLWQLCRSFRPGNTAEEVATLISKAVTEWSAGGEQGDDMTVVVLQVHPANHPSHLHEEESGLHVASISSNARIGLLPNIASADGVHA